MEKTFLDILNDDITESEMCAIFELIAEKLEILSISDMARKDKKSPNGIKKSNCYRKIKIENTTLCTSKLRDIDSSIDF